MVIRLGRLTVLTRRKEGKCTFPHCPQDREVKPGQQAVVLSVAGRINDNRVIFWKLYHPECFGPWLLWKCEQVPASKNGRKVMELAPEAKEARQQLVRTRARLIRSLRVVKTPEKLDTLVIRISGLDGQIRDTGYPAIPFKGRRSRMDTRYEKFLSEVKERYKDPRRVPKRVRNEFTKMGMEERFNRDMNTWYDENVATAQEAQGSDWETEHTDEEDEHGE